MFDENKDREKVKVLLEKAELNLEPKNFTVLSDEIQEELEVIERSLKKAECKDCFGQNCYACRFIDNKEFNEKFDFDLFRRKMLLECIYELIGEYKTNSVFGQQKDILYLVHGLLQRNLDT